MRRSDFQHLRCRLDPALPIILADVVRLRLALRNLLDNAVRHGGAAQDSPLVDLSAEGADLKLLVRDFGPGVEDGQLPHLAEPFYRADQARQRSTGGVGLGLHLSRLVAHAHGGSLTLRNADPGLDVTLRLPMRTP